MEGKVERDLPVTHSFLGRESLVDGMDLSKVVLSSNILRELN